MKMVDPGTGLQSKASKIRVLFVHNNRARFVQTDLAVLQRHFEVLEWYQRSRFVRIIALVRAILSSDVVVGWFASWHTLFPTLLARVFKRPTVLVVGGYDTAKLPQIGYGNFGKPWKKYLSLTPIRLANILVVHSEFIREEVLSNAGADPRRIRVVNLGFEAEMAHFTKHERENLVITVGNVSGDNLHRKGHEIFVRSAALLPGTSFVLIGRWLDDTINHLRKVAPHNVSFAGWVSDGELNSYYSRASVYVQPSLHEGFGMAVAEAMLYGCVPVVSSAGSLPEVVGNDGIVISTPNEETLAEAIRSALGSSLEMRRRVRERVIRLFSLETRCDLLKGIIEGSTDGTG